MQELAGVANLEERAPARRTVGHCIGYDCAVLALELLMFWIINYPFWEHW